LNYLKTYISLCIMDTTITKNEIVTENNFEQESRIEFARKYDLPDTATWTDITITTGEINRKEFAKQKGLTESATWAEINTAGENSAKN